MTLPVKPKSVIQNPDAKALKKMVGEMPNARLTELGNYNVATKVVARSKASTFVVTDDTKNATDQVMSRAKYKDAAQAQDHYIKNQEMIVIDGFIGPDPESRTPVRMMIEKRNANIAAMQQQLYFPVSSSEASRFEPALHVIYTPNLEAKGWPNDRLIAVDLENRITRVFNSDYFGESKKGGLRMWNKLIYDKGGLALHAGCKAIPVGKDIKIALIIGLSGTGKTTTTFTRQNDSKPIQDDFVAWLPNGKVLASENGCFAKTFGLDPKTEPQIYNAVVRPEAYLENVSVDAAGKVNFFDDTYTQNGRATFPMSMIAEAGDLKNVPRVDYILILNRNDNIIPAVARLDHKQAAAFFMLGETQGTSAGGVEEAGKALRVPGTNPFFPMAHGLQATRFLELLGNSRAQVFLMNTGWVGGKKDTPHSRKVKIPHSSAIVQALVDDSVKWARDPDFGYEIAAALPGITGDDEMLLRPRAWYEKTSRKADYEKFVDGLKRERVAHLRKYPNVPDDIVNAVG